MKIEGEKLIISREDLHRRVAVIIDYANKEEMLNVQAAVMDVTPDSIVIPNSSFGKYNKFRKKHGLDPLSFMEVEIVNVAELKKQNYDEKIKNMNDFVTQNKEDESEV